MVFYRLPKGVQHPLTQGSSTDMLCCAAAVLGKCGDCVTEADISELIALSLVEEKSVTVSALAALAKVDCALGDIR